MKHLKTFEAYGYEYNLGDVQDLNEGFSDIVNSIMSFLKKNIVGELSSNVFDKITTEFRQDLSKLTPQFNFDPKEKENILQSITKLKSSLPEIKSKVPVSESVPQGYHNYGEPSGAMTYSSYPRSSGKEDLNILQKIFKYFIAPVVAVAGGVSNIIVIWKVVFEWMIMHRGLIPLDLGIWGYISLIVILLTTLAAAIDSNRTEAGKDSLYKY